MVDENVKLTKVAEDRSATIEIGGTEKKMRRG